MRFGFRGVKKDVRDDSVVVERMEEGISISSSILLSVRVGWEVVEADE